MNLILVASVVVRLIATVWSAVLVWRIRDWRMGFLTVLLLMTTLNQAATLYLEAQSNERGTSLGAQLAELPGLAASAMAVLFVLFLQRMLLERNAADKAVSDSQALYHSLVEDLPQCVYRKDLNGRYTFASTSFAKFLGRRCEEIVGMTARDFFRPAEAEKDERDDRRVIENGATVDTVDERGSNGDQRLSLQKIKSPLFDSQGEVIGIQGIFWDISERRRAEKELLARTAELQAIMDNAEDFITRFDSHLRYLFVNRALIESSEIPSAHYVGKTNEELGFPAEWCAEWDRHLREARESNRCVHLEFEYCGRRGRRNYQSAIVPERRSGNGVETLLCITRDITDLKRAQQALQQAQEELLRRQQQETERVEAELARVRDELVWKTRLATLGQMSAQIAHEIRTPLYAISNTVAFFKRSGNTEQPEWREPVELIEHEVHVCNRIISNLLEMTHRQQPSREPVELARLVNDCIARLHLPDAIRFHFHADPDPFVIHVDPVQFRQVLDNLLHNALDAVDGAGAITVTAARSGDQESIVVRDTGPGIPAEQRSNVFDLFFTTKAQGTGLGLGICRQVVEQHAGTIRLLEDEPGGAAFEIRLPRNQEPL